MANNLMEPADVVSLAINDPQFDTNLIKAEYIEAAQLGYIKPLLGTDFYDLVVASPSSYSTLVGYIKHALAYYTLVKALPFIHIHLVSQGIQLNWSDYGNAATDSQRAALSDAAKSMGDTFAEELKRHLDDNTDTYTDYSSESLYKKRGGLIIY